MMNTDMVLPAKQESPVDVAAALLFSPDEASPGAIAAVIGQLDRLQEEGLAQLEIVMDRRGPLTLDRALEDFASTGPILGYGRLIAELRRLYMVRA